MDATERWGPSLRPSLFGERQEFQELANWVVTQSEIGYIGIPPKIRPVRFQFSALPTVIANFNGINYATLQTAELKCDLEVALGLASP